jgi:acyl carrier protein
MGALVASHDSLSFSLWGIVWMVEFDEVKRLIGDILQLGDRVRTFGPDTPLLGSIPEFDSMAVVTLINALEEQFGIQVADDEISAETFETLGKIYEFVREKVIAGT